MTDSLIGKRVRVKETGKTGVVVGGGNFTVAVKLDTGHRVKFFLRLEVESIEEERHAND